MLPLFPVARLIPVDTGLNGARRNPGPSAVESRAPDDVLRSPFSLIRWTPGPRDGAWDRLKELV